MNRRKVKTNAISRPMKVRRSSPVNIKTSFHSFLGLSMGLYTKTGRKSRENWRLWAERVNFGEDGEIVFHGAGHAAHPLPPRYQNHHESWGDVVADRCRWPAPPPPLRGHLPQGGGKKYAGAANVWAVRRVAPRKVLRTPPSPAAAGAPSIRGNRQRIISC